MIAIWFEFRGLAELIRDVERAQEKLAGGFEEPLRRTRDALWQEIRELFASRGQSTTWGRAQHPWRSWATDTRDRRALRLPTTWATNDYYDVAPGPIEDLIGVWTGQMRERFTGDVPPGFSEVGPNEMEMGIRPIYGDDVKWAAFIKGWTQFVYDRETDTWHTAHQPPRPVYENLHADDVALSVFANWLRDEVPLFQQAEDDQSQYLGMS